MNEKNFPKNPEGFNGKIYQPYNEKENQSY